MQNTAWDHCLSTLEKELTAQQFNTWIRPLHAVLHSGELFLLAPNKFIRDRVNENYAERINQIVARMEQQDVQKISFDIGSNDSHHTVNPKVSPVKQNNYAQKSATRRQNFEQHKLFTFDTFVEGKCNQLGRAAALQVGENPGDAYNPLFLYGDTSLGKTHLMLAAGNLIKQRNPSANVVYLHAERFVTDMVRAIQHNLMDDFKKFYRSVDALLIDDIQFFVGKDRSQEEFFHTFNSLLEDQQQIILTCDRFPKSVDGLEERLKSRFGWGLTVALEPPELETRVAILNSKASYQNIRLSDEVSFFIAERIRSNVRDLEGALRRVVANSQFTGRPITLEFAREALRDLLTLQDKLITIENIQKTVAEYYKLRVAELSSKKRTRSIARPRQIAMAITKEVTNHSLPEIGEAFGGRDHTTVLHACRKIAELRSEDSIIENDYQVLLRTLTT